MTQPLCAAPHCATRHRHHPTCADDQCGGCLPRQAADGLHLCDICTRRIAEDAPVMATLYLDLELQLIRAATGGERTTGSSSSGAPVPDDHVVAARDKTRRLLATITRYIATHRGISPPTVTRVEQLPHGFIGPPRRLTTVTYDPVACGTYIARHNQWLAASPQAGRVASLTRQYAHRGGIIWRLAYPAAPERLYVGDCPLVFTDPDSGEDYTCGARLYQSPDQPLLQCGGCGTSETIEQWRRWLVPDPTDHYPATAYTIAAYLSQMWKRPVDPGAIKKWGQRDKVQLLTVPAPTHTNPQARRPVRDEQGRTLYDVASCFDYAKTIWGEPHIDRRAS